MSCNSCAMKILHIWYDSHLCQDDDSLLVCWLAGWLGGWVVSWMVHNLFYNNMWIAMWRWLYIINSKGSDRAEKISYSPFYIPIPQFSWKDIKTTRNFHHPICWDYKSQIWELYQSGRFLRWKPLNPLVPNIRFTPLWCSKHLTSGTDGSNSMTFLMQLSLKFWSPAHHTRPLNSRSKGLTLTCQMKILSSSFARVFNCRRLKTYATFHNNANILYTTDKMKQQKISTYKLFACCQPRTF
jgi:hypothetical protein